MVASLCIRAYGYAMETPAAQEPADASGVAIDGAAARRRRELKGLSVADLAPLCGITPGYLSLIELGRRRPSPPVFARICDALGVAEQDREQLVRSAVAS